jgi:Spy/CpxP family protein refolding chaperone
MKRLFVSAFACLMVLLNWFSANPVQAQPLGMVSFPGLPIAEAVEGTIDFIKQLEAEVLPQLESILTPEQRDQFKSAVADGTSFRKAFKSLTLTPDQKSQLGTLLKSLPKKDAFASLTPDQKKQLFMKKKELFTPTPEEIGEKISAGIKVGQEKAGEFAAGASKNAFKPSPADIVAKITEKMKMMQTKFQPAVE